MLVVFRIVKSVAWLSAEATQSCNIQGGIPRNMVTSLNPYTKYHSPPSSPIFLSGVEEEVNEEWKMRKRAGQHQCPFPMLSW